MKTAMNLWLRQLLTEFKTFSMADSAVNLQVPGQDPAVLAGVVIVLRRRRLDDYHLRAGGGRRHQFPLSQYCPASHLTAAV